MLVCPEHNIVLSEDLNPQGYRMAHLVDASKCTGCCACATICPDAAIEVLREEEFRPPRLGERREAAEGSSPRDPHFAQGSGEESRLRRPVHCMQESGEANWTHAATRDAVRIQSHSIGLEGH